MKLRIILFALAMLAFVQVAIAAPKPHAPAIAQQRIPALQPLMTTYDIYVGGLHLVTADILFEEQDGKYLTRIKAQTYGFWHKILKWDGMLQAQGKIADDHFVPAEFSQLDIWGNKPKTTKLHFDARRDVSVEFDPPSHDEGREAITPEQRIRSFDPITALLQMLAHVAIEHSCAVTVPVFDGKRRFDITGIDAGSDTVNDGEYSVYNGPARLCDASFKMIAGEWKDRKPTRFWQKNDKEEGREPFHIWLATLAPGMPEMPVRLESGSVFGLIIVHLTGWHYATPDELKAPDGI